MHTEIKAWREVKPPFDWQFGVTLSVRPPFEGDIVVDPPSFNEMSNIQKAKIIKGLLDLKLSEWELYRPGDDRLNY